ncbi:MAG: hypothetical protein M1G31_25090 [Pseudanabaena sp. Salubria-1]|nr:hypothetical protein [Pseudanabaena sp. Salubria-1]
MNTAKLRMQGNEQLAILPDEFQLVCEEVFQKAVDFINHRPRKSLDYRTPYEVFFTSSEPAAFNP